MRMGGKQAISTTRAPAPAFSFSQAVRKGPIVQVSGQGAVDAASGEYRHQGDVGAQTGLVLASIAAILEAAGASFDDVVMLRVYLTDRALFPVMNEAYAAFVTEHSPGGVLPARTTVFPGLPHPDMLVEIDALAVVGD